MSTQSPAVHSVHFYHQDSELIDRLCAIVSSSLRLGDSAIIVATQNHRNQLVGELKTAGINVRDCVRQGRYIMLDAEEALASFMRDGMPDNELFYASIGSTLHAARQHPGKWNDGLTVFGEMVALLWARGRKEAALALEQLWNHALSNRTFHLHCAYPKSLFSDGCEMGAICEKHSHVLEAAGLRPNHSPVAA